MSFLKSIVAMKLQLKMAHPGGRSHYESARLDVMPDLIRHPEFLDSRFHGNDRPNHAHNSRLLSITFIKCQISEFYGHVTFLTPDTFY